MKAQPDRDHWLLFATRSLRLFCYGCLSIVLALYLIELGLDERQVGVLFTLTLAGDAVISLWLTTTADRLGRRRTLLLGALLMAGAGLAFGLTRNYALLVLAAVLGVISPADKDIGPFLAVEQSSLTQLTPDRQRTQVLAWYNLAGSFASALGALFGGWFAQFLQWEGQTALQAYQLILMFYALGGLILWGLFLALSPSVEPPIRPTASRLFLGLHRSQRTVFQLSALFALDAFAGGLIVQSLVAYWFHLRFGVSEGMLGSLFFFANLLAGASALLAVRIARRIGLLNTMVFTHLPSNLLLMLVPLMPSLPLAAGLFLLRYSLSQMDVPTRQSYTMAVVAPDERSAASGVTTIARSIGSALSPSLTGLLLATPGWLSAPFLVAGGLKVVYDLLIFRAFRSVRPPEEQ